MKYCTILESHFVLLGENGFEYDIKMDRIKEPIDLIGWIIHLTEKTWVHADMIRDLTLTVCGNKGWEPFPL